MKSKMFKKLMAAVLVTTMTAGLAACSNAKEKDPSTATGATGSGDSQQSTDTTEPGNTEPYDVIIDPATGKAYDLGGMEIIIRDWFSGDGTPKDPRTEYEEERADYREWIQKTYNFTIKQMAISDWTNAPKDFKEYVESKGDDQNYVFTLRPDPATTSAMYNGLMYDLSTLSCLDFSSKKFTNNNLHKQYMLGDHIYAMYAGYSEARTGVFFNCRLLEEATGLKADDIYDMQKNGTWTWDKFIELCEQIQQDTDNDGVIDVYACNCNNGILTEIAVESNGGEFIGKENGKFVYKLDDPKTIEGINFAKKIFDNYWEALPDGAQWNYYMDSFCAGNYVFCFDQAYCGQSGQFLEKCPDDWGFVFFPKPNESASYVTCWDNNPAVIPSCYDADRAWKIAFAWNLYTDDLPGADDDDAWKADYMTTYCDKRAVNETIAMMRSTNGMYTYHGLIPDIQFGPDLTWNIGPGFGDYTQIRESIGDAWKAAVEAANSKN